jgi:copper chaperone NosL
MKARILLFFCALAAACNTASEPVDPVWDKQACQACRMIVDNPRFAAQLLEAGGERRFFDDIGCLAELLDQLAQAPRGIWVRDGGGRWVDAKSIRYADSAPSPMDYGFVPDERGKHDFEAVRRATRARRERATR